MANKKSFILYTENRDVFESLPDEECAALIRAIFQYEDEGTIPDLPGSAKYVFLMLKKDLDRNNTNYEKVKLARSKAGKASAEARNKANNAEQNEHMLTNVNTDEQEATNSTDNVNVNVNDNVSKEKENKKKKKEQIKAEFEELWSIYPRKQGKKDALKHYSTAIESGTTYEMVKKGIEAYKTYIEKTGTDLRYVKMGSAFFCQRSWADDWTVPKAREKPKSNTYIPEPPKYRILEPEPDVKGEQMPDYIREKIGGMF